MKNNQIWIIGATVIVVIIGFIFWKKSHPKQQNIPQVSVEEVAESAPATPAPSVTSTQLYQQAQAAVKDGNLDQAKQIYHQIETEQPGSENMEQIQGDLESLNMQILFSNRPTADAVMYQVVNGDSLGKLAKKFGTTVDLIKRSNNLTNNTIRLGQKLRIWTAKFNIFVDKSQNVLMVKKGDEVFKLYHVSTGKDNSTPVGDFTITNKLENPVWFNKGIVVPPDSPANVLGSRWLGFDIAGYGIHGTVEPEAIGQQVTAGCVRMRNEEVEELFTYIPVGTKVQIVD